MCARASEQGEYNEFCHYFGTENSHRIANNQDAKETVRWREREMETSTHSLIWVDVEIQCKT